MATCFASLVEHSLTLVPKDKIQVQIKDQAGTEKTLTGVQRDRYFELLDPKDPDTLLEQVAVSHMPVPIGLGVWGYLGSNHDHILTRMKVDYIRFWQPDDHYTDMEPVYQ